mgnify:CR=1 FL=1|tara:strand:- start:1345 stop:2127 length:783 start_codon:yes stop_codon:yes gene_type:complete
MSFDEQDYQRILEAGWDVGRAVWDEQSDYEKSFMRLELSGIKSPNYYEARIEKIGFDSSGVILDVGCGLGQWSTVLANKNQKCIGLDVNTGRLGVARHLSDRHKIHNVEFLASKAEKLPFDSQVFDAVFCYGVFMFTDMPSALGEFSRVLKPNGKLYVNANTWGWYANLIINLGLLRANSTMIRSGLGMIGRFLSGESRSILVTKRYLTDIIKACGFEILQIGAEGECDAFSGVHRDLQPAYPSRYYGMQSILEILSVRR